MMNRSACLICLDPLGDSEQNYHPACCRKLFGSATLPSLPYSWQHLNDLAAEIIRQNITVPGVQPKISLHFERGRRSRGSRFTLVGMEGGYILKPPVAHYPEMAELEHLTMRMALNFSIATAECGLIPLTDGQLAFITKRMDRDGRDKLHMEDMCQLTDRLTEQKYRGSMEKVGKTVLRYCTNSLFDAIRLFEVSLFCFLTGNADMHLKNFSLLYRPGGEIHLSPAYDLLPTKLLLPEDQEESALTINGRKKRLTKKDLICFAQSLLLNEKQIANVFARFTDNLSAALQTIEKGHCSPNMKHRYARLVKERANRLELL